MVTAFSFAASYGVALALELLQLLRPRPILRVLSLVFGGAGLLAHTIYVWVNPLPLETAFGSLVFLAWVLAIFYFYGSLHHRHVAWGLFVLPVVLGLVALADLFHRPAGPRSPTVSWEFLALEGKQFWPIAHGLLLILAAVGVCVGFVASVMYLAQVYRLRKKMPPGQGMRLLSLERLESMNRRAILIAFPLLTAGLLVGLGLLLHTGETASGYVRILSVLGLWLVFAILLYLRYRVHARGRRMALLTIVAFALLLFSLLSVHPFAPGGAP
jgi:ABC-type transport system involved in cytochrome c biogenesis permease subunit